MIVKLICYTPQPELVCALAMRGCRTKEAAYEIKLINPPEYYIRLATKFGHYSVLEHVNFTFSVKGISRSCSHQIVRHRIASYSQQSQRSVNPTGEDWYVIPKTIKEINLYMYQLAMSKIGEIYAQFLKWGIPKEDARFILPNATKTNIVITMNGRELLHFFKLRLHKTAQWEIRQMANLMLREVKKVAPAIFEGFK